MCLYVFHDDNGSVLWCLVYVDDALLADDCHILRTRFVTALSKRFPTEDKGELSWILNVAITRDRPSRQLAMSQALYVSDLLTKFEHHIDPAHTRRFESPLEEGIELVPADQPEVGSPRQHRQARR